MTEITFLGSYNGYYRIKQLKLATCGIEGGVLDEGYGRE